MVDNGNSGSGINLNWRLEYRTE